MGNSLDPVKQHLSTQSAGSLALKGAGVVAIAAVAWVVFGAIVGFVSSVLSSLFMIALMSLLVVRGGAAVYRMTMGPKRNY